MTLVWKYRKQEGCYAAEGIVYCANPVRPDLQSLNIYIPEALMGEREGTHSDTVAAISCGTAYASGEVPIVFYNDIGGYAECVPAGLTPRNRCYLDDGYVLVSVGARGRQTLDGEGRACGKAPSALVDLKAAVRWLRAHADDLPAGNIERIVSVGTSAGGAMSSLLAVSGNAPAYLPMLEQIGACMGERDDVFAAQCYCPIIDLEHADMAYEWMFRSKRIYTMGPRQPPCVLGSFERELSRVLAESYPAYVNGLDLGLELGADGRSGSYYEELMGCLTASLQRFVDDNAAASDARASLLVELDPAGMFIERADEGGMRIHDLDAYVRAYIGRMKGCPAFDPVSMGSPENEEFGRQGATAESSDYTRHFARATSSAIADVLACGNTSHLPDAPFAVGDEGDLARAIELINPMTYLAGERVADIAPHVRIRVGSRDADHSFSASFNLYRALLRRDVDVDYEIVWGRGHCEADRPGEFSAWVDSICK